MKKFILLLILVTSFSLSGCTNEQIQEAIDDCKGDPECTEIIDDVITEELEARGIQGGKMTLAELEDVYDLLEIHKIVLPEFSNKDIVFELLLHYLDTCRNNSPDLDDQYDRFGADLHELFGRSQYEELVYSLEDINSEDKQYLIYNDMRFILYKTGVNQFHYEIQGDYLIEFTIDTELNKLYKNNNLQDYNVNLIAELLNGVYVYDGGFINSIDGVIYYRMHYDNEDTRFGLLDTVSDNHYEVIFRPGVLGLVTLDNGSYEYEEFDTKPFEGNIIDFIEFLTIEENYNAYSNPNTVSYYTEMFEYYIDMDYDYEVNWQTE